MRDTREMWPRRIPTYTNSAEKPHNYPLLPGKFAFCWRDRYNSSAIVIAGVALAVAVGSFFITTPTQATDLVADIFNPLDLGYSVVVISLSILVTLVLSRIRPHPQAPERTAEDP